MPLRRLVNAHRLGVCNFALLRSVHIPELVAADMSTQTCTSVCEVVEILLERSVTQIEDEQPLFVL